MKVIIFCGGYGTRMWPVSRKSYPKQFYPLVKGKSFFQLTLNRFRKVFKSEDIFVSTEDDYLPFVKSQAHELPKENIICEPERRDNLGAVGLATAIINSRFPGEVVVLSWSDHLISRELTFLKAILSAGEYASVSQMIVSVDEKPSYPSVHHGWIQLGKTLDKVNGFRVVEIVKHIEKPNLKLAKKLYSSGKYLINTGYRAFKTDVLLSYYKTFSPKVYDGLLKIAKSDGKKDFHRVLRREYKKFPKESIEYAIFEKLPSGKRATIPVDVVWEDAGTWELFYKAFVTPKQTTIVEGGTDVEFLQAEDNLVVGLKGKVIAIIGLSNIAVVDTRDGLLVCSLDKTDKVKDIFKKLEKTKKEYVE